MRRDRRRRSPFCRGVTAGLLLATLTKDDERVTLQILGDGPLGGVTVDATAAGRVRAYLKRPGVGLEPSPGARPSLARGHRSQRRRQRHSRRGSRPTLISGQTALVSGEEIDEDVEAYLEKERAGG